MAEQRAKVYDKAINTHVETTFLEKAVVWNIVLTPQTLWAGHPFKVSLFALFCASSFITKKQTVSCFKNNRQKLQSSFEINAYCSVFCFYLHQIHTLVKYLLVYKKIRKENFAHTTILNTFIVSIIR